MKMFYLHLALFIISTALIRDNFFIMAIGPYKDSIISLNASILVTWAVCITVCGFAAFMEGKVFSKLWEAKRISKFTKVEELER